VAAVSYVAEWEGGKLARKPDLRFPPGVCIMFLLKLWL